MSTPDEDILIREWLKRNWNNRLMDTVSDGVYVVTLDGNILQANAIFTDFWTNLHGEWLPNLFSDQMIPEDLVTVKLGHQAMLEGSKGGRALWRLQDKTGVRRYFEVTESPIRSGSRLWGIIGIVRERSAENLSNMTPLFYDAEERDRLEHSIRSSLGLIRGYAFALDRYPDLDRVKQMRFISHIRDETDRLSRWLDNVLEAPQMEQELLSSLERVSLVDIIRASAHDIGEYASRRGIKVEQHLPDSLPEILASRDAISRIMENLLDNAVALSPPEGIITVAAHSVMHQHDVDNGVEVMIAAASDGIDTPSSGKVRIGKETVQDRLPYPTTGIDDGSNHMVESSHLMESRLGLTVARRLTESLGGRIGVTSGPGKSTTFTVLFPMLKNANGLTSESVGRAGATGQHT